MTGALAGIKVVDFSSLLPGPMATLMLSECGADIIKIERPDTGDEMRSYTPRFGQDSVNFGLLNGGKKSIVANLKDSTDIASIRTLLEKADVLVEGFRPGVMQRLGLGYEDIRVINPGIIYCSITGYGQATSKSGVAGHDLNYIGDAGLLSLSTGGGSQPVLPPTLIADIAGGTYPALLNILLALFQRERTGVGAYIDISMTESLFPLMYWAIGNLKAGNKSPKNSAELVTGGSPRYNLYRTLDGRLVAAAPLEDRFWEIFVNCIGIEPQWIDDEIDPLGTYRRVAEIIGSRESGYWADRFSDANCCCSIVKTVQEALEDPVFAERDAFSGRLESCDGQIPALPLPLVAGLRASICGTRRAPALGEHNEMLS